MIRLAALLFCAPILSGFVAPDVESQELSPNESAVLADALNRGALLYRYDQVAWHTTDALLEDVPREQLSKIKGYVVVDDGQGPLRALYYGLGDNGAFGVYSVRWNGSSVTDRHSYNDDDRALLSDLERRLIALRSRQLPEGLGLCGGESFNTVILPSQTQGGADSIYYLTPQTDISIYPLGGHHRNDVRNGEIVAQRKFTNGCINLKLSEEAEAMGVSHLLDPVPTEIHVFSMLAMRKPLYVMIDEPERVWVVESIGGEPRFRLVSKDAAE